MLDAGFRPGRAEMEAWAALYAEGSRDERVLAGITGAVLRCPPLLKEEWISRLGLRDRWRSLAAVAAYRDLAGAYLVLLQPTDGDLVEEAESGSRAPPSSSSRCAAPPGPTSGRCAAAGNGTACAS